jgi:hypothetical protein
MHKALAILRLHASTEIYSNHTPHLRCAYIQHCRCVKCDAGFFQASSTASVVSCTPCPAGFFASEAGQSACSTCAAGSFAAQTNSSSCTVCSAGVVILFACMDARIRVLTCVYGWFHTCVQYMRISHRHVQGEYKASVYDDVTLSDMVHTHIRT